MAVFALWSAPRARSTAFFRSMLERDDIVAVHEPFSDLVGLGETDVNGRSFGSIGAFLGWLRDETSDINVFVKDTPNSRLSQLLDNHEFLATTRHAFLIRRPEEVAASFYAIEPTMRIDSIGLEFLHTMYEVVGDARGSRPVVIDSDDLVSAPHATMTGYCAAVGLPFIPEALTWTPGNRHEWRRSERWHTHVSASSHIERIDHSYTVTVDTSPKLRRFANHHRPYYELLWQQRLVIGH